MRNLIQISIIVITLVSSGQLFGQENEDQEFIKDRYSASIPQWRNARFLTIH
jgi:hypothetical protein